MPDLNRHGGHGDGLLRQFRSIGVDPDTGEEIHAPVLALEPTSIGSGGGGGVASAVAIADGAIGTRKATVTATLALKVDGSAVTQPVSGTFWQAEQPVSIAAALDIADRAARLLGHVTVDNFPATQAVTGTFWQTTQPVSGTFWQATQPVSIASALDISDRAARLLGHVTVDNASLAVTGTFWQTTQPVSGTFWQATQPISAASLPLPTGAAQEHITAVGFHAVRLTDGTSFYDGRDVTDRAARLLGHVTVDNATLAVTGPLTDAQLRASAVPTKETAAVSVGSTISAANTAVTLTLAAPPVSQFHYITSIEVVVTNPTVTAVAAAATNLAWTSTNLGGLAWNAGTLLAAGAEKVITRLTFGPPLKSTLAATASTIVAPACGAGTLCRIQVTYYTGT